MKTSKRSRSRGAAALQECVADITEQYIKELSNAAIYIVDQRARLAVYRYIDKISPLLEPYDTASKDVREACMEEFMAIRNAYLGE